MKFEKKSREKIVEFLDLVIDSNSLQRVVGPKDQRQNRRERTVQKFDI